MAERSVIEFANLTYLALREYELDSALGYARTCYEQELNRDFLRLLINSVHQRRKPGVALPLLAATVVKENVHPPENATQEQLEDFDFLYRAYKGAIMQTMSIRSVWVRAKGKKKKKAAPVVEKSPTKYVQEVSKKHEGQLRMFS